MPRTRNKSLSGNNAAPGSVRRMKVKQRKQRVRRAPTAFSPTAATPPLKKSRKPKVSKSKVDDNSPDLATSFRPEHQRLEKKIKSQAHRLRYSLAFIEAYEAEGWRKSSRDKLKPNKELEAEHLKITKGKRALIDGLRELKALNDDEPQVPSHAMFEDVHCSRCGSTEIEPDNDILLCDSPGCHRAYHQQCQTPIVLTVNIPVGDESWFCEVCLAIFECLKSINSVFGTTYEDTTNLFPELVEAEQAAVEEGGAAALVTENDDEEEDEDFVCDDEEAEDEDESDEETTLKDEWHDEEEEVAEEVPESAQDLLFLREDDVIDLNHRSTRSKSKSYPRKPKSKKSRLGATVAKLDRKTGELILGVVAELKPPADGRYSRWRVDYRDGSSELLTCRKLQAAIDRANTNGDQEREGSEDSMVPLVRSKRKRKDVDYRQLNELMFAGKNEDSEDDETFEVEESSEDELDDEGETNNNNEKEDDDESHQEVIQECGESVVDESSPSSVTAPPDKVSEHSVKKRSRRERPAVNYLLMHEGLLS